MDWVHLYVAWSPGSDFSTYTGAPSAQAYVAGPPAQWAGHWGVPPLAPIPAPQPPPPPGWDQQALAASFETMSLTQPPQRDWYFDTGATSHMASDTGILSSFSPLLLIRIPLLLLEMAIYFLSLPLAPLIFLPILI